MVEQVRDRLYLFSQWFLMAIAPSLLLRFSKLDIVAQVTHVLFAVHVEVVAIFVAEFNLVEIVFDTLLTKLPIQFEP